MEDTVATPHEKGEGYRGNACTIGGECDAVLSGCQDEGRASGGKAGDSVWQQDLISTPLSQAKLAVCVAAESPHLAGPAEDQGVLASRAGLQSVQPCGSHSVRVNTESLLPSVLPWRM